MSSESPFPHANDPHNLSRFLDAQEGTILNALAELRGGRKRSHWMWFIFPQFAGLGSSPTAHFYAIKSLAEAEAFLNHPVLGPRLQECCKAILGVEGRSASEILGFPDDMKLRSCATLFARLSPAGSVFHRVLEQYFRGEQDVRTLQLLATNS
jgi:uncharacterized protein (DUF1810 family)